jgi:hypothetical protein
MRSFDSWRDLFAEATEPISLGAQQRGQGRFPLRVVYQVRLLTRAYSVGTEAPIKSEPVKVDTGVSPFRLSQLVDFHGRHARPFPRRTRVYKYEYRSHYAASRRRVTPDGSDLHEFQSVHGSSN